MKILLTANMTWNLAHFRKPLIAALLEDGHEVCVLSPPDESAKDLEDIGCQFLPIVIDNKGLSPKRDLGLAMRFFRAFKTQKPDIILSYTIKNNIFGGLAAKMVGIPFIPNVTGLGTAFLSRGWLERMVTVLYKVAFRRLPCVLFQNADDRDLFIEKQIVDPAQAVLVPGSGIDLDGFQPTPLPARSDEQVTFLFIGRVLRDKGILEYVEAAKILHARHPEIRVQILGHADVENRTAITRETIDSWEKEGAIEYLGATTDVRPFIAAADCVVLPSYREGTPRTLLEAAAMARPLVATDVPGCREVVTNDVNGFLCQKQDPADLAAAMERMVLIGTDARTSLGNSGRKKVEAEFDQAIVVKTYQTAIHNIKQTPSISVVG